MGGPDPERPNLETVLAALHAEVRHHLGRRCAPPCDAACSAVRLGLDGNYNVPFVF